MYSCKKMQGQITMRNTILYFLVFARRFFKLNFLISYLIRGYIESLKHQLLRVFSPCLFSCIFSLVPFLCIFSLVPFLLYLFSVSFIRVNSCELVVQFSVFKSP